MLIPITSTWAKLDNSQVQKFTTQLQINTNNLSLAGDYPFSLRATDLTTNKKADLSFSIKLIDPCETTTLSFFPAVTNMVAYVGQTPTTQTVFAVDTVGATSGKTALCGTHSFSINLGNLSFFSLKLFQN